MFVAYFDFILNYIQERDATILSVLWIFGDLDLNPGGTWVLSVSKSF